MSPHAIDDARLKRVLTRELRRLADSGQARPPSELLERLAPSWPGADVSASGSSGSIPPREIYSRACPGVVVVGKLYRCRRCSRRHVSTASGFVASRSGLVVTCLHVVDDTEREAIGIVTHDGTVYPVESVLRTDRHCDLAVLQVPAAQLVELAFGEAPRVGEPIYVLSHPAGRLYTFTAGIVSRYAAQGRHGAAGDDSPARVMTVTAAFARGSSGAPVLDSRGAVVGVARQTKSIYYRPDDGAARRLQMVLRHCAPAEAFREIGFNPIRR